jgi:hypothetical protein
MSDEMSFHITPKDEVVLSDEQRIVVHVRTILCGTECFPSFEIDSIVRRFKCGVSSSQNQRMTTWVPEKSYPVLLIGTSNIGNVILTCRTAKFYSLSLVLEIPRLAPGVILVGNCTLDYDETFRFLIYDGENLPPVGNKTASTPNSVERYERLRDFFPRYFQCSEAVRNTFVLQWVGHYEHCAKFLTGEINVGHAIGGLVSTTDDAMTPTRPVNIKIPPITISRFKEKK